MDCRSPINKTSVFFRLQGRHSRFNGNTVKQDLCPNKQRFFCQVLLSYGNTTGGDRADSAWFAALLMLTFHIPAHLPRSGSSLPGRLTGVNVLSCIQYWYYIFLGVNGDRPTMISPTWNWSFAKSSYSISAFGSMSMTGSFFLCFLSSRLCCLLCGTHSLYLFHNFLEVHSCEQNLRCVGYMLAGRIQAELIHLERARFCAWSCARIFLDVSGMKDSSRDAPMVMASTRL